MIIINLNYYTVQQEIVYISKFDTTIDNLLKLNPEITNPNLIFCWSNAKK